MMEEAEALLRAARAADGRGERAEAKELHLRIISLYPRTPEAEEAIRYLTTVDRAAPQRVAAPDAGDADASRDIAAKRGN